MAESPEPGRVSKRLHRPPPERMRIVVWHGYLLSGTGSNIYTRALVREWSRAGHEVVVICQERHPEAHELGGARVVRPELPDGLLPVFVLDRYEGLTSKLLQDWTEAEKRRYVEANTEAVRAELPADLVFANHVLLGAPVGAATGARFAVKAHGSELEYAMRGNEELERWGRETLAEAEAVFVGSEHIRTVLEEVVGDVDRVYEVPPGVDVEEFTPQGRAEALRDLIEEAEADPPNPRNANERLPDEGNAERLAAFFEGDRPTILYFGKLLLNKGVHILLEAIDGIDARVLIVGFGDYREELELLAGDRATFTGTLEHRHLVHLIPLADVTVVPSIFPEAFGMVAAEAAAGGSLPLVARHSGLAEIAAGLEQEYPPEHRDLAAFATADPKDLQGKLEALLGLPQTERERLKAAARKAVVDRWSWASVRVAFRHRGRRAEASDRRADPHRAGGLRDHAGPDPRRRGGVRDPRPGDPVADEPLRGPPGGRARHRARGAPRGRADRLRGRGPHGPLQDVRRGRSTDSRATATPRRARRFAGSRASRDRYPPVEPVAGAADHRHAALPPQRRDPALRRLAQQQLRPASPRRHPRRRPRRGWRRGDAGRSCCCARRRSAGSRRCGGNA